MQLPTSYQEFIHLSRYSRWLENENRRETWEETVNRYFKFFDTHLKQNTKCIDGRVHQVYRELAS